MKLNLRELPASELPQAARLVARAMHNNPVDVRAFVIADPARRTRALTRFFTAALRGQHQRGSIIAAYRDDTMLGVCAMTPPGRCQPGMREKLRILPAVLVGNPPGTLVRVLRWVGEWSRHDPIEPHWHLGPVAVSPESQGQGIGSAMMTDFCSRLETLAPAYLETDKSENVRLYQRFEFIVVAEADVLGTRNWFMLRRT
jgi:ribosomal protein S18 acetylase RimI-like enzyme